MQTLQIGNVTLKNNLILGPMAGVTDLPFRLLCAEQGAGLLCMEMVSAKAILYNNKNTKAMLTIDEREHPVSLQLFGSDPQIMGDIAKRLEDEGVPFDILDINMGCPVPKVVNNGEGEFKCEDPAFEGKLSFSVEKADGAKCERCWSYSETVGTIAEHPTLCKRCAEQIVFRA